MDTFKLFKKCLIPKENIVKPSRTRTRKFIFTPFVIQIKKLRIEENVY